MQCTIFKTFGPGALLAGLLIAAAPGSLPAGNAQADDSKLERMMAITVYKTPTCGCCGKWVDHVAAAGFDVTVEERNDLTQIKRDAGIAPTHQSCHTGITVDGGYVFEGHIPARYMKAFLSDPPAQARGLVVPAMPVGSPGMEYEEHFAPYDVLLLTEDGRYEVFAHVSGPEDQHSD